MLIYYNNNNYYYYYYFIINPILSQTRSRTTATLHWTPPKINVQRFKTNVFVTIVGYGLSAIKIRPVITGPPRHSAGSQYCFARWRLSLSVVICNTSWRAYSPGGGPVVLHPDSATPCSTPDNGRDRTGKVDYVINTVSWWTLTAAEKAGCRPSLTICRWCCESGRSAHHYSLEDVISDVNDDVIVAQQQQQQQQQHRWATTVWRGWHCHYEAMRVNAKCQRRTCLVVVWNTKLKRLTEPPVWGTTCSPHWATGLRYDLQPSLNHRSEVRLAALTEPPVWGTTVSYTHLTLPTILRV